MPCELGKRVIKQNVFTGKGKEFGDSVTVLGNRAAENAMRYMNSAGGAAWLVEESRSRPFAQAYAINDFRDVEIWSLIRLCQWDWSRFYYRIWQAGAGRQAQRVGPIFASQAASGTHFFRKADPEGWQGAIGRLADGYLTAAYGNSPIMGRGKFLPPSEAILAEQILENVGKLGPTAKGHTTRAIRTALNITFAKPGVSKVTKAALKGIFRLSMHGEHIGGRRAATLMNTLAMTNASLRWAFPRMTPEKQIHALTSHIRKHNARKRRRGGHDGKKPRQD